MAIIASSLSLCIVRLNDKRQRVDRKKEGTSGSQCHSYGTPGFLVSTTHFVFLLYGTYCRIEIQCCLFSLLPCASVHRRFDSGRQIGQNPFQETALSARYSWLLEIDKSGFFCAFVVRQASSMQRTFVSVILAIVVALPRYGDLGVVAGKRTDRNTGGPKKFPLHSHPQIKDKNQRHNECTRIGRLRVARSWLRSRKVDERVPGHSAGPDSIYSCQTRRQ